MPAAQQMQFELRVSRIYAMGSANLVLMLCTWLALTEQLDGASFSIGNLLSQSDSSARKDLAPSVWSAVNFASQQLSRLYKDQYDCDISLTQAETHCDVSYGTRSFFELAKDTRRTLMVFGGSCDTTIKPIAESVKFFNLTLLSYTETDPQFADTKKYHGFYRLVPSEAQHNDLRVFLVRQFNWTRIGTVYLSQAKYTLAHNLLLRKLDKIVNVTVTRSILSDRSHSQYDTILNDFSNQDVKIVIALLDLKSTIELFCHVFHHGMYGKSYQWIIAGHYESDMLDSSRLPANCSRQQLLKALNGTLRTRVVEYSHELEDAENVYSVKRGSEQDASFKRIVRAYMNRFVYGRDEPVKSDGNEYFHGYAFDILLTSFKAIGSLIERDQFSCKRPQFERNIDWFSKLNDALNSISFEGVTGRVSFKNGERVGEIMLEQLLSADGSTINSVVVYVHEQSSNKFHAKQNIAWHGKKPPNDHTIKIEILYQVPTQIFAVMSILATGGILLALLFLIFNIKFRAHKFIKMSSPYLNNLIIVGCLLSYTSIYFIADLNSFLPDRLLPYLCVVRIWLLTIGFTLAFGAMFSKTYRVHAILTNSTLTKKVIKDYKLFGIVVFLLVIDLLILLTWQIFDPLQLARKQYERQILDEKLIVVDNLVCESNYFNIWIGTLFSYKSLLILFGCFFAYETRHVSIPALNDSKYIGISVYNVLVMCSSGAAISFIVHDKSAAYLLTTIFIFSCTSITLCLVFFPKVLEVKRDPQGKRKQKPNNNFKKTNNRLTPQKRLSTASNSNHDDMERKLTLLLNDNRTKSEVIEKLNSKIKAQLSRARSMGEKAWADCLQLLESDDSELKRLIEEEAGEPTAEPANQLVEAAPVVASAAAAGGEDHDEHEIIRIEAIVKQEDGDSVQGVYSAHCDRLECKDALKGKSYESDCETCSQIKIHKRRFNPPPRIIDLNIDHISIVNGINSRKHEHVDRDNSTACSAEQVLPSLFIGHENGGCDNRLERGLDDGDDEQQLPDESYVFKLDF
nr:G protein-coupled receptor [Proales similis]